MILFLALCTTFRHFAHATQWQCEPGSVDLNAIYPELVSERQQSSKIGEGTDGYIYLPDVSSSIAIKRFSSEDTSVKHIYLEYWIGQTNSHTNIAKTHSLTFNESSEEGFWEMEMEYVEFPLLDLLDYDAWAEQPWDFSATSCIFAQVVEAVAYLHGRGIAHRDLKVENIMVTRNGIVKLIDFGSATVTRDALTGRRSKILENWVGTPITMAPETNGEPFLDPEKADVWSLGVILLRLVSGVYPWEPDAIIGGLFDNEVYQSFLADFKADRQCTKSDHDHGLLCRVPEVARGVLAQMLQIHPEKRINSGMVLQSQWLRNTNTSSYVVN